MRVRRVVEWLGAAAIAGAAVAVIRAQPTPQYRTGVSLLRLDASVVDDSGRAVGDLKPDDFQVTIDGQPRKVLFARFTGAEPVTQPANPPSAPSIPSYAVNSPSPGGRAIVIMVDLDSVRAGSERSLLETAAALVDNLRPVDAAAVIPMPGTGVDLTRDRKRVSDAIRNLRGTSQRNFYRYFFTLDEALAFERDDKRVIAEVVERECSKDVETGRAQAGFLPVCPPQLTRDTRDRLMQERLHIQSVLTNVGNVATQLASVTAPTSIVLLSAGLGFEPESLARFQTLQRQLRDTGVGIATVQLDQPDVDASSSRPIQAAAYTTRDRESGLANLATMAGGVFYAAVGRATGVFERLRTEITEAYELGVEPQPGDLDGKPHEVKVTTNRKAAVRARKYVTASNPPADPAAYLSQLIAQPVDVGDLPIAIAAHSVRGDEAATLKVMIRADIGHGVATTPPVRYRAVVIGANGEAGVNVTGNAASDGGVVITTQLAPGRYRVRLAAIEAGGRSGTLEAPIVAGLRSAGPFQLGDVIVGTIAGQSLTPSIYASAGSPLIPTLEMTTADAARFAQTTVGFEIRRAGSEDVLATASSRLEQTPYDRQQIARATVRTNELAPGEYSLSAIVKVDGQPAGRVSRTFVLDAAPPSPVAAAAAAVERKAEVPPAPAITDPLVADALQKASAYVASYGEKLSAVVGLEKYIQNINPVNGGPPIRPRQIVAEFALVKSGAPVQWTGYRDVIEVNGDPVADRRDRILKILTESSNPFEDAAKLTAESARFNVGPVSRNFNVPTTALFFFDAANLSRFSYTRKGTKRIDGVDTLEIAFQETRRPTLVRTRTGKDVPCEGTLWIVPEDGTIVRTRLQFRGFADVLLTSESPARGTPIDPRGGTMPASPISAPAASPAPSPSPGPGTSGPATSGGSVSTGSRGGGGGGGRGTTAGDPNSTSANRNAGAIGGFPDMTPSELSSTAEIEVTYRRDEKLGMWLPAQMTEEYQGAIPRINQPPIPALARSRATYSDFKQFGTSATVIGIKK